MKSVVSLFGLLFFVLIGQQAKAQERDYWEERYYHAEYLYFDAEETDSALIVLQEIHTASEQRHVENDTLLPVYYYYYGCVFDELVNVDSAEYYFLKAFHYADTTFGKKAEIYYWVLEALADLYSDSKQYQEAVPWYQSCLVYGRKLYGEVSIDYAIVLKDYARNCLKLAEYNKALSLYQKSVSIVEQLEGDSSTRYVQYLHYLAMSYGYLGRFDKSIVLQKEVVDKGKNIPEIRKELGEKTLFTHMHILYVFYQKVNALREECMHLNNEMLAFTKTTFGVQSQEYQQTLIQVLGFYKENGEYDKALDYAKLSYQISNEIYGIESSHTIKSLHYVSGAFKELRLYDSAHFYLDQALKIGTSMYGDDNVHITKTLGEIGDLLRYQHKYLEATKYYERAIDIVRNSDITSFTQEWYIFPKLGRNLAFLYRTIGRYEDGIALIKEVIEYREQISSIKNNVYASSHMIYANLLSSVGNDSEAVKIILDINPVYSTTMSDIFSFQSTETKENFMKSSGFIYDNFQSVYFNAEQKSDELLCMNLNNLLTIKGAILNSSSTVMGEFLKSNDTVVQKKVKEYRKVTEARNLVLLSVDSLNQGDSLQEVMNSLEGELMSLSTRKGIKSLRFDVSWEDVKSKLKPNEIAIEFNSFQHLSDQYWLDTFLYVAYLIHPDWDSPKMIYLFEKQELEAILKKGRQNLLYAKRGAYTGKNLAINDQSEEFYNLVWAKIEKELNALPKINTIYYAPTELLHFIPFVALGNEDGILGMRYHMIQLSTVGKLAHGLSEPTWNSSALYGGINYHSDTINSNSATWKYLPGTKTEVQTIQNILDKKHQNVTVYSGDNGSEASIKKMSGNSPTILHLATHGFFYSSENSSDQNAFSSAEDPLFRTGLILAGANETWTSKRNTKEKEDGILTAAEISVLDLSQTDLVVLSACETGLGDITKTEGVYGLQRAFKMAGVDILIMSLWQVPDEETAEFMTLFYSKWAKGNAVRDCFRYAQIKMYKKYPNQPNKWAGFVLLE